MSTPTPKPKPEPESKPGAEPPEINATAASLLGFLHAGPMTGWEIDQAVRATISNFWNVTRSQVYRELHTLAALGYVEVGDTGPRDRRPHALTSEGRAAFTSWIARHPGPAIIRMPLLLTVFFGQHVPPERLAEIVATERAAAMRAIEEYRAAYEEFRQSAPFVAHVIRFGIGHNQLMVEWLDSLLAGAAPSRPPARGRRQGAE